MTSSNFGEVWKELISELVMKSPTVEERGGFRNVKFIWLVVSNIFYFHPENWER